MKRHLVLVAVLLAVLVAAAQQGRPPILVLVSLDGWRWDYLSRANAPNLQALASRGMRAEGLIPSFPPKTFPNHYTIVTGLYPEHHGIVSNAIADPEFPDRFTMSADTAKDARWWGGEPLWVTAILQGQRAASMFWPGSEAPIKGLQPTYWRPFDDTVPNADRVKQVLDWLALPPDQQPSFITLYLSEVDHAGHDFGPESPQLLEAARHIDDAVGWLVSGVDGLGLRDRVTLVIVSDHGMAQLSERRTIVLDDYVDVSTLDVIEWTPILMLRPKSGSVDEIYRALKGQHPALEVYKRADIPKRLHYRDNARIPPLVALADEGWTITSRQRLASDRKEKRTRGGDHGYDPRYKSMQGLFVAAGPRVRDHVVAPPLQNIHVYNFLCEILGLRPAPNDGNPAVTRKFLK